MSGGYRKRRQKLRAHDAGRDRHAKPVAQVRKEDRQRQEHETARSNSHRREATTPVPDEDTSTGGDRNG